MISLKLLLIVDKHLSQVKGKTDNDSAVLDGLAGEIVMGDFFQFLLIIERFLWNHPVNSKKI